MITIADDELLIERTFDAPVALVYRLWESRDHVFRWWGPEDFTMLELDWALTPGRAWRGAMVAKRFDIARFGGVIREVEKNRRIAFTFRWDHDAGALPETLVTVAFAERDGRTVQSFHQGPFATVESRDSHVGGWHSLFNRQQLYAENLAVAERKGFPA